MGLGDAIQNSKIIDRIIEETGLQSATVKLPVSLEEKIQPVLISNPKNVVNVVKHGGTSATLFTTPATNDFFLTSLNMTSASQNQSGTVEDRIAIVLESGESITSALSCICASGATSETTNSNSVNFVPPIKLKRASLISLVKGSSSTRAVITGYFVDSI